MTLNGCCAGIIVGAVTVIVWKNALGHLGLYELFQLHLLLDQHCSGKLNG